MKGSRDATIVRKMDSELSRFRLTIAYDGRPFAGWQSQPDGNTVQDQILAELRGICPSATGLQGSGRTDAGVSALGQVAHFDCPVDWKMDATAWRKALNTKLPPSIRIMDCEAVDSDFHARFSATGKIYEYRIFTGEVLPPLDYGLVWHRRNLPIEEFSEAMSVFEGTHQFRAFSANRNDGKDEGRDTERTIFDISSTESGDGYLTVSIHGDGFLYKMVRFLIGTGSYLALNRIDLETVEDWLRDPPETEKAPYCAPADGLSLFEVCYE